MNFRNYGDNPTWDAMSGKPLGNATLARQSSVYSLTFDEFQNTIGGTGKDFGSMNMDELLKNIWTAEETSAGGGEGHSPSGNLQRQGSLTLPRTLSQKRVDEVWRDLIKDGSGGAKDGSSGNGGSSMPQRQPTLGEMTLEEFLVKAGVVREDIDMPQQQIGRPNNDNGWFSDFSRSNNNSGLLGFQQPSRSNGNLGDRNMVEGNNMVTKHILPSSLNSNHSQRQAHQQHQPPLFPKPTNVAFASPIHLLNNAQLGNGSPGRRGGGMIGVQEHSMNGTSLVHSSAVPGAGMLGLATAQGASPRSKISPDGTTKSNADSSLLSPVPYVINRGRKCGPIDKVVERRQRRMIKNRESAARSRARKQVSIPISHYAFMSIGNKIIKTSYLFYLSDQSN